jgi:predicted nucleic acid-binding protein
MNPAGSVLLDTNIIVAHFRSDPSATTHPQAAPAIYLPWIALGELH